MRRIKHGSPPLVWSSVLQKHAQEWANKLAAMSTVKSDPEAETLNEEGENLGWILPTKAKCAYQGQTDCYSCASIVKHWYDEMKNYDFENGMSSNQKPVRHFVQVMRSRALKSMPTGIFNRKI